MILAARLLLLWSVYPLVRRNVSCNETCAFCALASTGAGEVYQGVFFELSSWPVAGLTVEN